VTTERRIARLEASLSPVEAVLHWLNEAQTFATLTAYLRSVAGEPLGPSPLDRVLGSVESGVRAGMKGKARAEVDAAVTRAARQAALRFKLVLRLNVDAEDAARLQGLIAAGLFYLSRALASDELVVAALAASPDLRGAIDPDPASADGSAWRRWREAVFGLLTCVYREEEARRLLEERYLEGHRSLFADIDHEWTTTREQAERLARIAVFLQSSETEEPAASFEAIPLDSYRADVAEAAAARADYVADVVRAEILQLSGEHGRAAALVARHLLANRTGEGAA
jgi:hypothetical protein